jgi:hypothetical protein
MAGNRKNDVKELLIEAYAATGGYVAKACEMAKVSRQSWCNWMQKDPAFKSRVMEINEAIKDSIEQEFVKQTIQKGNWSQMRYYLETHCKDRGYERESNHDVRGEITLKIEKSIIPDAG